MKYITSCPKCETQFLLNDELIKAHHGKVQCGTCELVFNAKTHLTEVPDDITSPDEYQASLASDQASTLEEITLTADAHDKDPLFSDDDLTEIKAEAEPSLVIPTDTANVDTALPEIDVSTLSPETIPSEDNTPSIFDDLNKNTSAKTNKTNKTKHPILWGLLSILLLLLAAAQTIYHNRVKIAAEYPQFKPLLVKACSHLNCKVGLPKNLDFITIGDSDMQENDSYQSVINFTSSLTNTAPYPIAYPNIALTLTNEKDNIVIRKIIQPEDYLPANKKVTDGIEGRGVTSVKLELYVHEATVAGYRILLLYP